MDETTVDSGIRYSDGDAVLVRIRKRDRRYVIDDAGVAVAKARAAGTTSRWLVIAERVVAGDALNVNRRGVVFVPAVEGRDIDGLARRVAATSRAIESELLGVEE
jgi:hypothetical protein